MTAEPDTVLDGITYLQLDAEDQAVFPIKDAFDRSHAFIGILFFHRVHHLTPTKEEAVKKGDAVLVHCEFGISRSATIVISYLIKHHDMSLKGTAP